MTRKALATPEAQSWDWQKEPRDWSTIPTNVSPAAPPPVRSAAGYTGKSGEAVPFAGTTEERRALAALKALRKMGYTSTPPAGTTEPTGATSLAGGMTAGHATGVVSPPR